MELSLLVNLDALAKTPLHRQLYQQIRDAILRGTLKPQTRLPASRQLAKTLEVSRTTVVQSYDQLISEGYLQTKPGAGTFVCKQIPDDLLLVDSQTKKPSVCLQQVTRASENVVQTTVRASGLIECLSDYGVRLTSAADYEASPDCPLSFRYGLPDLTLFPWQQWRRLLNREAGRHDLMGYDAEPMGHVGLRRAIAQYIRNGRAVRCGYEQILITSGTQQALSLIGWVLMNAGEAIAFENPGYLSAKRIFSAQGASIVPVPVDSHGILVEEPSGLAALSAQAASPRLVYVTPSHQFPTGVLMSLSRRLALLRWARETGSLIVEDDYDSEFRYSGSPIPALQGLDDMGRVLYVGTFSKLMFPGLRLGYVVLPPGLVDVFRQAKWLCDRQCALMEQAALANFIERGYLAQHVRRMRAIYDRRRRSLVTSIQQVVPDAVVPGDASGLHILVQLPCKGDAPTLIRQAKSLGVGLFSTWPHYWQPTDSAKGDRTAIKAVEPSGCELIFGFGDIAEKDIKRAITTLAPLFQGAR